MNSEPLYNICDVYRITNKEYENLYDKFDQYAKWAAWQLIKKNSRNSHTNDWDDIYQEVIWSMVRAGSYYKRQTYIEKCFQVVGKYLKDDFLLKLLAELKNLWENRKRHGANRQKFGKLQEDILDSLVKKQVPDKDRPKKDDFLVINKEFAGYCKSIALNTLRSIGKLITKEKPLRDSQVSINKFSIF